MPEETKTPVPAAGSSRPSDGGLSPIERPKTKGGARRILGSRFLLAALLLVIGACFLRDSPLLEPSYSEIHQEFRLILSKTLELADRRASDAEWTAFEEETRRRLTPIVDGAEQQGTGFHERQGRPHHRLLLSAAADSGREISPSEADRAGTGRQGESEGHCLHRGAIGAGAEGAGDGKSRRPTAGGSEVTPACVAKGSYS